MTDDIETSALAVAPEGLSATDAATFCGVSRSKWHDMNLKGLIPDPVELGIGRCHRWVRWELVAWLLAGAPSRSKWRMMRDQAIKKYAS